MIFLLINLQEPQKIVLLPSNCEFIVSQTAAHNFCCSCFFAAVAQLAEHGLPKPRVAGSSPVCRSFFLFFNEEHTFPCPPNRKSRLQQIWDCQSIRHQCPQCRNMTNGKTCNGRHRCKPLDNKGKSAKPIPYSFRQ